MANKIQVRRGAFASLPTLDAGEPAWTTDTEALYVGNPTGSGNVLVSTVGGVVGKSGTPAASQVAFWANVSDITGTAEFVWNDTLKQLEASGAGGIVATRTYTSAGTTDFPFRSEIILNDPTGPSTGNNFAAIYTDVTLTATAGWDNVALMRLQTDGFDALVVGTDGSMTSESYVGLAEQASSPSDTGGYGKLFTRTSDSALIYRKDTGTEFDLTQTAGVSGGGSAGRIAVWTGSSTLADDADFLWDTTTNQLTLAGITLATAQGGIKQTVPTLLTAGADDFAFSVVHSLNDPFPDTQTYRLIEGNLSIADDAGWPTVYLLDLQTTGVSQFSVADDGSVLSAGPIEAAAAQPVGFNTRSRMYSDVDGNIRLTDNAGTDFGLLQFGGTTSAYAALKHAGTALQLRYADDSDYASLFLRNLTVVGGHVNVVGSSLYIYWNVSTRMRPLADGNLVLTDWAATDFNLLQFGGTTASYPALKRSTTILECRLADDSDYALFRCGTLRVQGDIRAVGASHHVMWVLSTRINAPVDGDLRLTNYASDDFNLLQFGGVTSSYPALQRAGAKIQVRLADDSNWAQLQCGNLTVVGYVNMTGGANLGWNGGSQLYGSINGSIRLANSTLTDFNLLQFGGTTSAFPALKRSTTELHARLADDSDYCPMAASEMLLSDGRLQLNSATSQDVMLKVSGDYIDAKRADDSAYVFLRAANVYITGTYCSLPAIGIVSYSTRARISAPADGDILLTNYATTDFGLLQFGGTTSAFPALKRHGGGFLLRLADDSGYAAITALSYKTTSTGSFYWTGKSKLYSDVDGNIRLVNDAIDDFGLLQFGGLTSAFPAIKRVSNYLEFRRADDSAYTSIIVGNVLAESAGAHAWAGRTSMFSDVDGNVRLKKNASDDFVLLQFGGLTSSYPAIKRSSAGLEVRLADDSDHTTLTAFMPRIVEANTAGSATPNVLTAAEANKALTNEGATQKNYQSLPACAAGLIFTGCVQDSDGMRFVAQAGDTIRVAASVSTTGGYVESTTVGDVITLLGINGTEWFAIHVVGTGWATG